MTDSTIPTGKRADAAREPERNASGTAGSIAGKVRRRRVPGLDAAVGKATSGVKGVAGGARRASSTAGRTAAKTGRTAGEGAVVEKGTGTVQGTVGAVGSVVRTGLGTSLGFLVSKALLLLQLIKRLAMMALEVIGRLAQRVRQRAAARRAQSDAAGDAGRTDGPTPPSGGEDAGR